MSMQDTPQGERVHIAFFGRRNVGKSSLVNAVTGQALAVVSPVAGTTTDPVTKAMELLPLGPVLIIDTPGFDDEGDLGALRVEKTRQVLRKTDLAVLVVKADEGLTPTDRQLLALFAERGIPHLVARNQADRLADPPADAQTELYVSAKTGAGVQALKERMAAAVQPQTAPPLAGDLVPAGRLAILVVPIDAAAPKGRLILPQQQVIRDLLDAGAGALVVQPEGLPAALAALREPPALVITDSQVFGPVSAMVPPAVPLTSFSILMARHKGFLEPAVRGAAALSRLQNGDRVLIAEGCTHHRQCEDIGTVKLPRWLGDFTGKKLDFAFCSGGEFPQDLSPYALMVHCGGCMLNAREMLFRVQQAVGQGVPFVNYGVAIAHMHGILERSLAPFPALQRIVKGE